MSEHESAYTFGDGLPVAGVAPGSNLLVTGEAMGRAREVALSLVFAGAAHEDGMAVVSATKSERRVRRQYESLTGQRDRSRLSVIDCTGQGSDSGRGRVISSPGDLTGIAIQISEAFTSMRGDGVRRIRVGVDSLSTLGMYTNPQTLFRFLHMLSGRIAGMDGLGVYLVDRGAADDRVVSTLAQLCDGRIDVRESADGADELRTRGLRGQPREWTPFTLGP